MTGRWYPGVLAGLLLAAAGLLAPGRAAAQVAARDDRPDRIEVAQRARIGEAGLVSWAKVDGDGVPLQIGVTVDLDLFERLPAEPGQGPAGALTVLAFPESVRRSAFPDHFELHWLPKGHPSDPYPAPHFVLGFYRIPASEVLWIGGKDRVPSAARLPEGYVYAGEEQAVRQMGVRAVCAADLDRAVRFSLSLGYFGGKLISIGPMVTREHLLRRRDFAFSVPVPRELGGRLYYPTRFLAHYDPLLDAYQLILTEFVRTKS